MRKLIIILLATSAWAAEHDIIAARIIGSATTVADTTSACNVATACTGWVLELDQTVTGTPTTVYALGIGATNTSVATAKIRVHLTSPTPTGGTVARTLYGTHQLRRVYNSGYSLPYPNDETLVSTTLTLRIALGAAPSRPGDAPADGFVFSGDTSVTVDVGADAFTYSAAGNPAVTALAVTNSSTLAYPKAIANWTRPGLERVTGSTFRACAIGFGHGAHDGMPLQSMVFTAAEGAHTQTVTKTLPIIDPAYGDAVPVQEYCADIPTATFTQASIVTVNFQAIPWIGDSTAILDTTASPCTTQPTPLCAPITVLIDTAGTFGTAAAVVDTATGNDSTCAADSQANFDSNPNSNLANTSPCATFNKAAVVLRAYNAANSSPARTDVAGTIWVKAGSYVWSGASVLIGAAAGTNPDTTWLTVTTFPGVARTAVIITGVTDNTYNKIGTTPLHIKGITLNVTAGAPNNIFQAPTNGKYAWIDGNNLTMTSGTAVVYNYTVVYWTRNTVVGDGSCGAASSTSCVKGGFTAFSNTAPAAIVRGNTLTGVSNALGVFTFVGNLLDTTTVDNTGFSAKPAESAAPVISSQPILAFNRLMDLQNSSTPISMFATLSSPLGGVIAMNVLEWTSSATQTAVMTVSPDASTNTPVTNVMVFANTLVGQRSNNCYNDNGSTLRLRTLWSWVNTLSDATAMKQDTFPTANAARLGGWACLYGVGWRGNMDAAVTYASAYDWKPEFPGILTDYPPIGTSRDAQSLHQPPYSTNPDHANRAITYPGFIDRKSYDGTTQGAGGGNYRLWSNSPAKGLIAPGGCVLPYDSDGMLCNNSGYGSAGAFEQARLLTPVFW